MGIDLGKIDNLLDEDGNYKEPPPVGTTCEVSLYLGANWEVVTIEGYSRNGRVVFVNLGDEDYDYWFTGDMSTQFRPLPTPEELEKGGVISEAAECIEGATGQKANKRHLGVLYELGMLNLREEK